MLKPQRTPMWATWLLALSLCLVSGAVSAQTITGSTAPDLDVQKFTPSASPYSIFTVDSSQTSAELQVSGGLILNYSAEPLVLESEDGSQRMVIVEDQMAADVLFALGLFDIMELNLGLPVYFLNTASVGGSAIEGATIGDLRLRAKFSLLDSEDDPVGLGLFAHVGFPTGDDTAFTSSGQYFVRPGIIVDKKLGRVLLAANVAANLQNERDFSNLEVGSEFYYSAGVQVEAIPNTLLFGGELFGSTPFADFGDENKTPLEGVLGAKLRTQTGFNFELGLGTGILDGYGAPAYRVFGGVRFANFDDDWDNDGILNNVDACPRDPEDIDLFEDEDGCPDLDNDQDSILDVDDECPLDPEDLDEFEDENGCPDPDNDQDGITDVADECPNNPEDKDDFEDENGCPDPDNDQDGVLDVDDNCINTPGPVENKGCPYGDRDKDGISDPDDACPDDPEDKDGFEDEDGCPDIDNDKDGVLDVDDRCPNEAGSKKNNGCPEVFIDPELGEIVILQQVFFDVDKDTIKKKSFPILNAVAAILKKNPQVRKLEVQGHTDDQGSEVYNLDLSTRRALSVRTYLIGKGIEPGRLVSKGYGETTPKIDISGLRGRALNEARAENRRVQFIIMEQEKGGKTEVREE